MPAATSKIELIALAEKEFNKLQKLIAQIDETLAMQTVDGASIKDTIGHRAHWMTLFIGWYTDGQAGKKVYFPAEGYKWSDLKQYNADLREKQSELSWADTTELLEKNKNRLFEWINEHSDEELYSGPMKGANNNWTPGRWAEAAGPSHFRSAAKFARAVLKANS